MLDGQIILGLQVTFSFSFWGWLRFEGLFWERCIFWRALKTSILNTARRSSEGGRVWIFGDAGWMLRFGRRQLAQCHRPFNDRHPDSARSSFFTAQVNLFPFFLVAFFHTEAFQARHRKGDESHFFDRVLGHPNKRNEGYVTFTRPFLPTSPETHLPCGSRVHFPIHKQPCQYYHTWLPANLLVTPTKLKAC